MFKIPTKPEEIFPGIIEDSRKVFGNDLVSIILYGSAAGGDYVPGRSDINFMMVLSEQGIEMLDHAFDLVAKWKKRRVATPLFLTEEYIQTSLDVFPIEYLNFQNNHKLIYGKDVLKDLTFDPKNVRLQCEREVKGKLLLLREGFLESRGKGGRLQQLVADSVGAFMAIFHTLLYLNGKEIPRKRREMMQAFCRSFDVNGDLFDRLLAVKEGRTKTSASELVTLCKAYLKEVRKVWKIVDGLDK